MKFLFVCLPLILFSTVVISAQNQTYITGAVRDAAGAAVSNADVRLINAQQIVFGTTKTDVEGRFKFENVAKGSYVIIVSRNDFSPQREAVRVSGTAAEVNLELEVNQLTEQVTVTAETGLVEDKNKIPQQINVISEDAISSARPPFSRRLPTKKRAFRCKEPARPSARLWCAD